jgi:NAD(P)-dependent dehydrogenase (short-subunit alcohol dehydrogenase family)
MRTYADKLFDLKGRVAVVTGASAGLGEHFARVLAGAGAQVVIAARRLPRLEALADELRAEGATVLPLEADVTHTAAISYLFDAAEEQLGTPTIIVNNSGLARAASSLELEDDDWDVVLNTNLRGAWMVAREAARRMVAAASGGSIINLASITGLRVARGMTSYAASKAGLMAVTRNMALELARYGIRVNALAPGYILTDMNREFFDSEPGLEMIKRIPQRRIGRPDELDGALLLLASDASSYMSGSVITIDGGHMQSAL